MRTTPAWRCCGCANWPSEHPEVKELLPPDDLDVDQAAAVRRGRDRSPLRARARRVAVERLRRAGGRAAGRRRSGEAGRPADSRSPTSATCFAARTRTPRPATSGKASGAGSCARWASSAVPSKSKNQLLAVRDGAPVFVRDVAEVRLGYKKPDGLVRRFGESSIAVNCAARNRRQRARRDGRSAGRPTAELNEQILKPRGLQLTQVYDETEYIYSAVDLVQAEHLHRRRADDDRADAVSAPGRADAAGDPADRGHRAGGGLCVAVVFRDHVCADLSAPDSGSPAGRWSSGLAIPTSIVGTFLVLGMLGRSLNVISLAGLAFAVGMLVDNAVVVLENIYRRYSTGRSRRSPPPCTARRKCGAPCVASTLTTVAVFLPVVFVAGRSGPVVPRHRPGDQRGGRPVAGRLGDGDSRPPRRGCSAPDDRMRPEEHASRRPTA